MNDTLTVPAAAPASQTRERKPFVTIRPTAGWQALNLFQVWQYRDLLISLASRDVKLRYKQTALGIVWVVLQPLIAAGIFSFVFGKVANMSSDGVPYFIFSFAGLMAFNLFTNTVGKIGGSLTGNAHLISKVFFPRLILPLSAVPSTMIDFLVASGMMVGLMVVYRVSPTWTVCLLPVWMALLLMLAVGIGLCAASLMVSYRDVGYILPVFLQILMYASPVAYSITKVPANLRFWYDLNPLSPLIVAFRWSIFGTGLGDLPHLALATGVTLLVLLVGLFSFKRMERRFADVI